MKFFSFLHCDTFFLYIIDFNALQLRIQRSTAGNIYRHNLLREESAMCSPAGNVTFRCTTNQCMMYPFLSWALHRRKKKISALQMSLLAENKVKTNNWCHCTTMQVWMPKHTCTIVQVTQTSLERKVDTSTGVLLYSCSCRKTGRDHPTSSYCSYYSCGVA